MNAYAAFRSRDFRLLLAGNFLSTFGLQMMGIAVSWDLYLATRSAIVLGNVGFVQVAPFLLFALNAGQMADRHDRRRILLITQSVLLLSTLLLALSHGSVWIIYSCLFLTASARAFQGPSRLAILPRVVPPELLGNAITWSSSSQEIASVSGPALGGILLATVGSGTVYLLLIAFALLTLGCFALLDYRADAPVPNAPPTSLTEGLRFVWNNKLILSAMSLDLFAVLFGGATALLPIFAVYILHIGAKGLGWLRAAPSIGAVAMALTLAHSGRIVRAGRVLLLCVAGFGVATIGFGFSRNAMLSFALLLITGAFDNVSVVLRQSLVQQRTPDSVRGRVLAVNNIFISCSNQLGAVESGWTAAWMGATGSVAFGGVATVAIVAMFGLYTRSLRQWKQPLY